MTVLMMNTLVPRFIAPIVQKIQEDDPMPDLEGRKGKLRVRIARAYKRDEEVRLAAALALIASKDFDYIPSENVATVFGVSAQRWQSHLKEQEGSSEKETPETSEGQDEGPQQAVVTIGAGGVADL